MSTLRLFQILFWAQGRSLVARIRGLQKQSRLLLFVLGAFVVGYLGVGYWLFHLGLSYLFHFPLVGALLTQRLLFLIFGFVLIMLVFSNLVIGYASLFKNCETAWLLTLPVSHGAVYRWKFMESLMVSSWALMFLSAPLMVAWGQVHGASWWFYVCVLAAYVPFIVIPGLIGSWIVLLLVRILTRAWVKRALIILGVAAVVALIVVVRPVADSDAVADQEILSFDKLLRHSRVALNPYLPSAWLAESVLAWSEGLSGRGGFYFLLLLSYALMGLLVGFEGAAKGYYGSWVAAYGSRAERMHRRAVSKRAGGTGGTGVDWLVDAIPWFSRPIKAMSLKDARIFWREPAQWTQFMIFFGLLCVYVLNLRNIAVEFQSPFWEMMISYLNLTASSLTLSTLTTRFIFPQFSLEGRRLWIVGLAPLGLRRVLVQKLALAFGSSTGVTATVMILSSFMLNLPMGRVTLFTAAIGVMSLTLCALAVGLGALFPNFKEDNPSKIVSGFGGTLCLVLSFIYIAGFVAMALIPGLHRVTRLPLVLPDSVAVAGAMILSVLVGGIPFFLALRRVKNLEF